jgi:hypothetical protein
MSPLRQRMIEDMQLRGYSATTQELYARAVRQLSDCRVPRNSEQFLS